MVFPGITANSMLWHFVKSRAPLISIVLDDRWISIGFAFSSGVIFKLRSLPHWSCVKIRQKCFEPPTQEYQKTTTSAFFSDIASDQSILKGTPASLGVKKRKTRAPRPTRGRKKTEIDSEYWLRIS